MCPEKGVGYISHQRLTDKDAHALRMATQQQKTWGSERFRLQIEELAQRQLQVRPRGRPENPVKMYLTPFWELLSALLLVPESRL